MENQKKFFFKLGIFCLELGKNILFGIGNGAVILAPKLGDREPWDWSLKNPKNFDNCSLTETKALVIFFITRTSGTL